MINMASASSGSLEHRGNGAGVTRAGARAAAGGRGRRDGRAGGVAGWPFDARRRVRWRAIALRWRVRDTYDVYAVVAT